MPTNYFIHITHSNVSHCCYRNLDQSAALKENSNMGIYSRGKYLQNQYTSENFNKKLKRNKKLPKQKSVSFMPT